MDNQELVRRFSYHPPKNNQSLRYENIRDKALRFAMFILAHTPESREQTQAIDALDDVVKHANAAIARNE